LVSNDAIDRYWPSGVSSFCKLYYRKNLTDGTQSLICSNSPGHVGPPSGSGGKQAQTLLLL